VLLRVTVALPVKVATLPIGSSFAGWAGAGAPAGGVVAGTCAETFAAPASMKQPSSQTANETRCGVTIESRARMTLDGRAVIEGPAG
jgi:hypothetical protein